MILIADGGATKTEWCVLSGTDDLRIRTKGISPYFLDSTQITQLLREELMPSLPERNNIHSVYYYGTGCTAPLTAQVLHDALTNLFPASAIEIAYDLVAAAHSLCGKEKGIACILGTGSSSGYYNGHSVEKNIAGLGYVLGDEGSGAYLGKLLAGQYLYDKLDAVLHKKFSVQFSCTYDSLLERIYSSSSANSLLASFSVFLSENRGHPVIENILLKGLGDFFSMHISEYEQCRSVPIHFTGGVAFTYKDVLQKLCKEYSFDYGNVVKEPMDGLVKYYRAML
jgi:glucosamine kinase